ncbi:hypothetical protein I6A84_41700 [Frankia sp. CNm7]|uniref:Uncharacterized protein n=1 Tax=Frankia nepalensis TaxID=1836974 RepID=A0A937R8N5_9ACTN|nr:hypothetical protein [Frankia nepalensis]MBL7499132.1 hypothetical protein [Frankia nepalensis]MBL7515162.1 hypothetical protein [Frankia nepalensis]MBL7524383.1 hypothetical protein [Frankia nepalensis]MBL7625925.1 hypothetical protein [Frankia nepalensis]
MRVYLPSTLTAARTALADRAVPAGLAFAVTPAVREWYAQSDLEEMEYAALLAAARACLRLLDADALAPRRRVVFVADVDDGTVRVRDDLDRGVVEVTGTIPLAKVRAVHVDDPEAEPAVAAAAAAILEADLGGEDAAFVVDGAEGHELLWYATQELADLF